MTCTPASTRRSATSWRRRRERRARRRRPPRPSTTLLEVVEVADRRRRRTPCRPASGSTSKIATIRKPWSAKMSELAIAWPRLPGAEQRDVVLARGPQDLADLGDERVDVVADAALAELAEAREVAADLGRVDVRVVGELLRGDRLLAHLARLDQDLEVAREPRRDAEREALAVAGDSVVDSLRRGPRRTWCAPSALMSQTKRIEPGPPDGVRVEDQLADDCAVDLDTGIRSRQRASSSSSASMSTSRARSRAPPSRSSLERRAGLVAEVAAGPPVERHDRRRAAGLTAARPRRGSRGRRRLGEARGRADHRRVVGAELAGDELQPQPARSAQMPAARSRSSAFAATPPPSATRRQSPLRRARARASRRAGRRPPPGSSRRGRRGGASSSPSAELADRVDERRLEPAEAEVEAGVAASSRPGRSNASGSPSAASRWIAGPPG